MLGARSHGAFFLSAEQIWRKLDHVGQQKSLGEIVNLTTQAMGSIISNSIIVLIANCPNLLTSHLSLRMNAKFGLPIAKNMHM